jgi:hypothetical protein
VKDTIQILIDRYFNGETSLEEEQAIKSYFRDNEVDVSLLKYKVLFDFIASEKEGVLSSPIAPKIGMDDENSRGAKIVAFSGYRPFMRAAVAAVVVSSVWLYKNFATTPIDKGQMTVAPPQKQEQPLDSTKQIKPEPIPTRQLDAPIKQLAQTPTHKRKVTAKPVLKPEVENQIAMGAVVKHQVGGGNADTYENPELAYKELKAALLLVSNSIKKGTDPAEEGLGKVRQATELFHSTAN